MAKIPININDLPTRWHPQTVAEFYSLAHAGNVAGFVAALNDGNPDEVGARNTARRLWIEMRAQLGLPEWLSSGAVMHRLGASELSGCPSWPKPRKERFGAPRAAPSCCALKGA